MEVTGRSDNPSSIEDEAMRPRSRPGGLPLVVWVSLLTAIPILGLGFLAVREVQRNTAESNAARDVALVVEEQSAAINVFTPLQIERVGALGMAQLSELGLDPDQVLALVEQDYAAIRDQNTPILNREVANFASVVEQHDFGDRPDLTPLVNTAIEQIADVRVGLVAGSAAVEETQQAYDSMLTATDMFLTETAVAFESAHPDVFDAQRLLLEQDVNRLVIRTANIETALITDVVTGTTGLDLVELIAAQIVHDESLARAAEQHVDESIEELVAQRAALDPLSSIWTDTDPITPEAVSIQPELYDEFAALLVERLEYLEAVEQVTIELGNELVAEAANESVRIIRENRQTLLGLLAIGLGVLIFEIAIIRSFARPLRRLRRHVERIGGGELAVDELPLDGPSDIRRVTGALNDMAGTLDAVDRQLMGLAAGAVDPQIADAPIPGQVGTSIRESVDRLVTLTRELRESEERLQVEARHDILTSRLNRFGVLEHLAERLDESTALGAAAAPFAVMIVDLDGFKNVNDTNGQAIGDQMLCEVADRLGALLGDGGVVARIGGDEFMIIALEHQSDAAALDLGRRIIELIERPFHFGGLTLSISASVGARLTDPASDALAVAEHADAAVYHAKRRGRGRVEMYDSELQNTIEQAAEIELALRKGIDDGELVLHLQPTADSTTGQTVGAEALVRWNRPGIGLVLPDDFIPVAERSSLIIDVGRWVLREACGLIAEWKRRDPACELRIAVNVSGRHLVEADLLTDLDTAISVTGADPRCLEIELTESHLLDDISRVSTVLSEVRSRGIAVAVDDFGTGYSSMTYLQRLPLDAVKIDRSFVERATDEAFDSVVIESIVRLAGALGLEIVAEGIETEEQLAWLRGKAVHRMQGFLIARPMPIADAERVMFGGPLFDARSPTSDG